MKSSITASVLACAVLFCWCHSFAAAAASCEEIFQSAREKYSDAKLHITMISSDQTTGFVPYALLHTKNNDQNYDMLEHLNGERKGYALRGDDGFDYNQDRSVLSPLSWHPTLIWHKLFDKNKELQDYSCILTGRTRLTGHKVSIIRLVPQDNLRYSYVVAIDDEHTLPVELNLLNPDGTIASKISVLGFQDLSMADPPFPVEDHVFDNYDADTPALASSDVWRELSIPLHYNLVAQGTAMIEGQEARYQTFSDGLTSFRVYTGSVEGTVHYPALSNGSLTVYRKAGVNTEYAVVGEIPLKLAESVLSRIF